MFPFMQKNIVMGVQVLMNLSVYMRYGMVSCSVAAANIIVKQHNKGYLGPLTIGVSH